MPRLVVKTPAGPKTVPLGEEAVTFGRTSENTVPLDDVGVSRKHAQILFVGKGWEIVDLGSRNGTKVNGQKVPRAMLKAGDRIELGAFTVEFLDDAAAGGGGGSGLEIEELDLGAAHSAAPSPGAAAHTASFPAAGGAPAGDCVLRVVDGERKGTEIPLKGARTTFGRRAGNTVVFNEAAVSGVHCEITREANGYVLRDLGSTNGTLVDGDPVVETLLRHNSRIRIGGQRLLFVDPTVADIESSLSAGDDLQEWGLMKGEIDVSASRGGGGKGALVAAAVVIAGVGGFAYWVAGRGGSSVEVPPVKDNRIADFSFEEGVVRWLSPEEEGARASIVGGPGAKRGASGLHALEVSAKGGEDGPRLGRVEFQDAASGGAGLTVTPDAAYEVSAKVGGGKGTVIVVWSSSSRAGLVREVAAPLIDGSGSWPETRMVVVAPAHASAARVQLASSGGTALFDDVVFRKAEGAPPPDLASGDLRVRLDGGGFLEAVRGGEALLTQGGLAPSVDVPVEALLGATLSAGPARQGDALTAAGTLPAGGSFEIQAAAVAGGASLSATAKDGEGALVFTCPAGSAPGAVTLVLEKTALVLPEAETFRQEGVVKVIVGTSEGPEPFVLSADRAGPGWTFTSRRTPRGLRAGLAAPKGSPTVARLSVDLGLETQAARDVLLKARKAEAEGKFGEAAEAFSRVALEYHYLPDLRAEADKAANAILDRAKTGIREMGGRLQGSRRYRDAPDLAALEAQAGKLATDFAGHPYGEAAAKIRDEARAALAEVRSVTVERRVEGLYLRASDLRQGRMSALALLIVEEILRIAPPDNDHRQAAETLAAELRAEVEAERARLYGTRR